MTSRQQISAALSLLEIQQLEVSKNTGVSATTLSNMLTGKTTVKQSTQDKTVRYLEGQGIEFLPNEGVRKKPKSTILQLEGIDGFHEFMRLVMHSARSSSVDICVSGVDEQQWDKWLGNFVPEYLSTMTALYKEHKFNFRIIVESSDHYIPASEYAHYRSIPSGNFTPAPVYVFGSNVAMIEFEPDNVTIWIIHSDQLATAQRKQFNIIWDNLKK